MVPTPPRSYSPEEPSYIMTRDNTSTNYTTRAVSPAPLTNNPYRASMNEALEKTQAKLSEKKSSMDSTSDSEDGRKDFKLKKSRTTMFALPEDDEEDTETKQKKIQEREDKVKAVVAKDMKMKFRIRAAKLFLRFLNFGCSLVVLSLVANSFSIFFATRNLPTKNNLPPWAPTTVLWPTYTTLAVSCISLTMAIIVLISYWKGGHAKAEKAAVWFTAFSIFGFVFMIVLWAVVAGIITNAKNNSGGKDMWSWACNKNTRKEIFQDNIDYDLVCKQLDWSLVCSIIEIVVESLAIILYVAAFWRFASKSKLRKSMDMRDKARHELYLRKLADGDEDVYRPTEHEMKTTADINLAERGYSMYIPPSSAMAVGAPIIDPNSGLAIDPHTGAASKPVGHAL